MDYQFFVPYTRLVYVSRMPLYLVQKKTALKFVEKYDSMQTQLENRGGGFKQTLY